MGYAGLIGFIFGGAVGSGLTALILKKKYDDRLAEEIEDVKRVYSRERSKEEEEKSDTAKLDISVSNTDRTYSSGNTSYGEPSTATVPSDYFPKEEEEKIVERISPSESPSFPYLISDDTYVDTNLTYSKETLHYYNGDGVIADEDLEAIIDPESIVGDHIPEYFENVRRSEHFIDAIYIRNDNLSRDFEIIYHDDSFFYE